ncbi:hypothetical protein BDA96_03G045300 [Sorghum bicolor]|uniref:Uncharacterized protein n=1 Tax=Sorghum bicolor TaxID=4558 RepID=A0A921R953_SORBI|nr:hypothetical protein BDA96_03G045300 [Sorghum bicolor]
MDPIPIHKWLSRPCFRKWALLTGGNNKPGGSRTEKARPQAAGAARIGFRAAHTSSLRRCL